MNDKPPILVYFLIPVITGETLARLTTFKHSTIDSQIEQMEKYLAHDFKLWTSHALSFPDGSVAMVVILIGYEWDTVGKDGD